MRVQPLHLSAAEAMTSELETVDYRVDFWEQVGAAGVGAIRTAYGVSNYLLTDVDSAQEAIEWATENAGERLYVLFALVPSEGEAPLLVRLVGEDPTQTGSR